MVKRVKVKSDTKKDAPNESRSGHYTSGLVTSDFSSDIGTKPQRLLLLSELEDALEIDYENMNHMLLQHSQIYYQVSKVVAILISFRDKQEKIRREVEADVRLDITKTAEMEKEKLTVADVDARKYTDERVVNVIRNVFDLSEEVNVWSALRDAFGHRNYMLKEINKLYVMDYYATHDDVTRSTLDADGLKAKEAIAAEREKRS